MASGNVMIAVSGHNASGGAKGSGGVVVPAKPIVAAPLPASVVGSQVTLQTSPTAASHADLIKQLNQARAQGLVVLQQWGDKQVKKPLIF
jgi:hypothetical protein